jgi:hypothetical protein
LHSPFAERLLKTLREWDSQTGVLTYAQLVGSLDGLKQKAVFAPFGRDNPGSDFLFIQPLTLSPTSEAPPAAP